GQLAAGEERIRRLLVAGVRGAPFDTLLGRVVLAGVVLALAPPGGDLPPGLVALAGGAAAVVVVVLHPGHHLRAPPAPRAPSTCRPRALTVARSDSGTGPARSCSAEASA